MIIQTLHNFTVIIIIIIIIIISSSSSSSSNPSEPRALRSSQPLKMSTRDFSWGKGGRCVWLTTYHPRSAEHQENQGP